MLNSNNLLNTRLIRPILNSNYIVRERVNSILHRNQSKSLTLVVAAAGYGKSIAVSQWLQQYEADSCWIDLGEDCNDYRTFLEYVIASVKSVHPESLRQASNMINSLEVNSHEVISETFLNELLDLNENLSIVLDDYHLINNNEIHNLVEMILNYLSGKINLVIISRNDPPLRINQLAAYDNLCEIRGRDLRLTNDEIIQLAREIYNYELDMNQVNSIMYATEGWIIAVRLHLKIICSGIDVNESIEQLKDKQENLMEQMFHEVITVEQDDIYKGLLLATFSKSFTVDLIIKLMEYDTTNNAFDPDLFRERFEETINKSMFIFSLDRDNRWFRFHRLVHELLRKKLGGRYSKTQIKNFFIEASRYFEKNRSYEEAIHTALEGEDLDFAVSVIIGNYNELLDSEQFQRLGSWLNLLPLGTVETNPELLMIRIALSEAKYDLNSLASDLEILEKLLVSVDKNSSAGIRIWAGYYAFSAGYFFYLKKYDNVLEMADKALVLLNDNYTYTHSYIVIIRSFTLQVVGYPEEATELTDKYLALLPDENKMGLLRTHLCQVFVKSIQGKINRISASASLVKEHSLEQDKWVTHTMANYYLAASKYYMNKLDDIVSIYEESQKNGFAGRPNFIIQTGFFAAKQKFLMQDNEGMNQILCELYDYSEKFSNPEIKNTVLVFELELQLLQGNLESARELAKQVDFSDYPSIFYFYIPALTKIKLMLADTENWDVGETRTELEELIKRKEQMNLVHILVQAYPLMAIWHFRHGEKSDALYYLKKAIHLSKDGEFIRTFLDLGEEIHILIDMLDPSEKREPFTDKLLNGFHFNYGYSRQNTALKDVKNMPGRNKSSMIVNQRETQILELMVQGLPNKEIADSLYLSHGTVKTYIYNIYKKIDVKNRIEAIVKAQKIGLIGNSEVVIHGND